MNLGCITFRPDSKQATYQRLKWSMAFRWC